jgi:iron complex transport system permease protein
MTAHPLAADSDFGRIAARQRKRISIFLTLLVAALAVIFILAVGYGALGISPLRVIAILAGQLGVDFAAGGDAVQSTVVLSIRLPRALLAVLVGAALGVSGAALQGLFRNPMADPGLIGVSTGSALAAAAAIVLGAAVVPHLPAELNALMLPIAAFAGGALTTFIVYIIASREGRTEVATMLLAGIALNAITAAGIGLLVFISDDQQLRDLQFWLLGGLGGVTWERLLPTAPFIIMPTVALLLLARQLNAMLLGEAEARHLGFDVQRCKRWIIIMVALAVGASVALTGVIGFIGLVVPHLIRLMVGPDHRVLMPASIVLGASLLLVADLFARTMVLPAELPVGILTSCIGGPFFIWLLMRNRGQGMW